MLTGAAPTTSEWWTISLPTKVWLILEVLGYVYERTTWIQWSEVACQATGFLKIFWNLSSHPLKWRSRQGDYPCLQASTSPANTRAVTLTTWLPWSSQETLKTSFKFSSEHLGCHPDNLSISVPDKLTISVYGHILLLYHTMTISWQKYFTRESVSGLVI